MNILHLSTSDEEGGAARAASRLHRGLLERSVSSWIDVQHKVSDAPNVVLHGSPGGVGKAVRLLRPRIDSLPLRLLSSRPAHVAWSVGWLPNSIEPLISRLNIDVLHIHWIGLGFVSLSTLAGVGIPAVWTLHDSWSFTGGCHVTNSCSAFQSICHRCPGLGARHEHDLSWFGWQRKQGLFRKFHPTFVAPSRWMAERALSSSLLGEARIEVIPNGLDTRIFKPVEKSAARSLFQLPPEKRIILFGAVNGESDPNKGFDKLSAALSLLRRSTLTDQIELAVFGTNALTGIADTGFRTHSLGRLFDDASLAAAYSAADIVCVPSLQESFGQTALEAMACGTPVVAFGATGLLDIVKHGETGYLATPYDVRDLARGLGVLVQDEARLREMSTAARIRAVAEFDISRVASQHEDLYRELIAAQ